MKILYVNDQLLPDDATDTEQFMQTLAALVEAGVQVSLYLPADHQGKSLSVDQLEKYYQVRFRADLQQIFIPGARLRLLSKLLYPLLFCRLQQRCDAVGGIVYTRNLPTVCATLLLLRQPVVYETYRPWHDQLPILKPLLNWLTKHPRLLGVITHSDYTRQVFIRNGCAADRVRTIYNGYDPSRLDPVLTVEEAKKHLGIDKNRFTVVYTGHIAEHKGCGMILRLARCLPEVVFFLVGSTTNGPVEREAAAIANVQIIKWLPYAQTRPYLYMADLLLIPPTAVALHAGRTVLPIKTFLYMAAGRTILAPRLPDVEEILIHRTNAWLVEPDNLEEAVEAVRGLMENAELRTRLAAAAQNHAREQYTYAARSARIISFFQQRYQAMTSAQSQP